MTLAERLLAGEHHGCATWQDVAAKFGVNERSLRTVRKILAGTGRPVALMGEIGQACKSAGLDKIPNEGTRGPDLGTANSPVKTATPVPDYRDVDKSTAVADKWPSVEQFDRMTTVGESTLYDSDGNVKLTWVKTKAENDERHDWLQAIREMSATLPRCEPVDVPEFSDDDLLVVLPVGDPHVGLLSWHEDAGENFDLEIAERNLVAAFENLIQRAPSAARCLLIFIGDNTHADSQHNTTTKGTRVDVDGRTVKMVRTILDIIRRVVALSLAKFGHAEVKIERGNHDELISALTALALSMFYENEPRVTIDVSPEMYHFYRFGQNLIGTHHGDKAKPEQLLGVMACDRAKDWGETTHRRFYCGHYHHQIVKELPGLIVEYLPTLASSDAWHRAMGYRSQRAMYLDVFHREWGHVDRCIVGIRQLQRAA